MATKNKIWKVCDECKGTKIVHRHEFDENNIISTIEITCPTCEGKGFTYFGYMKEETE
jgi:DnaJ-class molecular chaperone